MNGLNNDIRWETGLRVDEWQNYITDDFKSEKELTDWIDNYASYFAHDVLEIQYKKHYREFYLRGGGRGFIGNTAHADFLFISDKDERILVECKKPRNTYCEVRNGIIQLMGYYCDCKYNEFRIDRMVLIVTKFDTVLYRIIKEFKLPIEVYVFSKDKVLKLVN